MRFSGKIDDEFEREKLKINCPTGEPFKCNVAELSISTLKSDSSRKQSYTIPQSDMLRRKSEIVFVHWAKRDPVYLYCCGA